MYGGHMDVNEAVGTAKGYVADLFADEAITHVGLEEVVFDEPSGDWKVTIGFARHWNQFSAFLESGSSAVRGRSYKVVRIRDRDGRVISLTDRQLAERTD